MKHAEIFTRLAQRADPNIPILEAAMEEIARLEEKLETSGYSPFTEEVEDILRSKNQNLFNALMESTKRTNEQAAEISRLKALVGKCSLTLDGMKAWFAAEENHEGTTFYERVEMCNLVQIQTAEALAAIKESNGKAYP